MYKVDEAKRSSDGISIRYTYWNDEPLKSFGGFMGCPLEKAASLVSPQLKHEIDVLRIGQPDYEKRREDLIGRVVHYLNSYDIYSDEIPGINFTSAKPKKDKQSDKIKHRRQNNMAAIKVEVEYNTEKPDYIFANRLQKKLREFKVDGKSVVIGKPPKIGKSKSDTLTILFKDMFTAKPGTESWEKDSQLLGDFLRDECEGMIVTIGPINHKEDSEYA